MSLQFVELPLDVIIQIAQVHWKVWYKLSITFREFGLYSIQTNVKSAAQQHFNFGTFINYLEIDGFYQHYFMLGGVNHGYYTTFYFLSDFYDRTKKLRSQTLYTEGIPGVVQYFNFYKL